MATEEMEDVSTVEVSPVWSILESHGVKLPDYITKLLQITGYGNLQSLSKLNSTSLIQELEQYTTNNLDPSDLELKEHEERFFFNQKTNKFSILPGHKHLIINAAETVQKVMQHAQEDYAREQQQAEDNDQDLCVDASEDIKSNTRVRPLQHFLADLNSSSSSSNGRVSGKKRDSIKMSDTPAASPTVEQEQQSLAEYVAIWLSRKLASGQLDPFILDVDYRINVIRPRNCASQPFRPDIYSFVCLRCKTTIKAFKRPNGLSWNATNIFRHLTTVHCRKEELNASSRVANARKQNGKPDRSSPVIDDSGASSSPPPSDAPVDHDLHD